MVRSLAGSSSNLLMASILTRLTFFAVLNTGCSQSSWWVLLVLDNPGFLKAPASLVLGFPRFYVNIMSSAKY